MTRYPHGRDLRKGRHSRPGGIYLITAVTHQRKSLFSNIFPGRIVVNTLRNESGRATALAYVLMPDHLHWLVQLQIDVTLCKLMQTVKSVSSHAINRFLISEGRIWQPGYHDRAVRHEEDVRALARYIINNPLRAKLVDNVADYPLWDAIWL